MIRSRARWMLAAVVRAEGDRRAGIAVLGAMDPLVRSSVLSAVTSALAAAMRETSLADDEAHVHRLAFLALAGHPADLADDVDAVREAYEARSRSLKQPSRFGATLTALATLITAALVAGVAIWFFTRPPPPLRAELPMSRHAWTRGGRPDPGSPDVRALFAETLPHYVVALDAFTRARGSDREESAKTELDRAHAASAAHARRVLGADAASFFLAVLDQAAQIITDHSFDTAADSHLRSIDALVRAIAARGLGYYVDAEIMTEVDDGRHHVYFSTFTVERVTFHESGGERVRTLRIKRLDRLNFQRGLLGYTRENISDALVLIEVVEDYMVDAILPALGPDAMMPLVDDATRELGGPWITEIEHVAAEHARTEARAIAGEDADRLGELFARRQALFRAWSERLSSSGWVVRPPRTYEIELARYANLEPRVPGSEWRQLEGIQRGLDADDARDAYRALEEALVRSIERHEVQHRLDYGSARLTHAPPALEALTGPLEVDGQRNRRTSRALAELSSYMSELARGPSLVRTNLALLSRFAFDRRQWGTVYCYAALAVIDGLALELGVAEPLIAGGTIDREALARVMHQLLRRPPRELTRAARSAWADLLGERLPDLD